MLDKSDLLQCIGIVSKRLSGQYLLVGAGGTALALHDIKHETRDIDFIVERGDIPALMDAFDGVDMRDLDVSGPGFGSGTLMPPDYVDRAKDCGSFGTISLKAMSVVDVIITKSTRYNSRDKADLVACRETYVSGDDILERLGSYDLKGVPRDNLRRALAEIFDVSQERLAGV